MAYPIIDLQGTWQLRQTSEKESIPAQVPGDNYSALLENGKIPEPYFGENEELVQWVGDVDWTYERTFTVPKELLKARSVILNLDSVDTVANLFINDKPVAKVDDMFLRYRFDVKPFLKTGKNTIRFDIRAVRKAGEDFKKELVVKPDDMGASFCSVPTLNLVRKCQCSGGWDWGISLPSSGIMGKIYLEGVDFCTLEHVYDIQVHKKNSCKVTFFAELNPLEDSPIGSKVDVEFLFNGERKKATAIVPRRGGIIVSADFNVKNPELWWPTGFGEQPLYPLQVTCDGQTVTQQIGLKELKIVNEKDEIGFSMVFQVNGVNIFAKGADWIPCDAMPQRHTPERYQQLLGSVKAAGINMLRIWGGGKFEEDPFYEECDRLGILLWHDNMFSCSLYPDHPHFLKNVHDEIVYQVKRLRHHACIGLWCGDNELIGQVNGVENDQKRRDALLVLYDRLNQTVARAVAEGDDTHVFWPSSPCAGPNNFSDNWLADADGDMHYWQVWHGGKSFEDYYNVKPRFCSEFGFQSFPSIETVKSFANKEDFNVFSPVFDRHQKGGMGANARIVGTMGNYFRLPESFEGLLYLSQIQQAIAIKTGVEYWHSLRPRCMGTIFWQLNDNWPVSSWASVEYSGRWKPLQYMARRFYASVQAVAYRTAEKNPMEFFFISDLPCKVDATVTATLIKVQDAKKVVEKKFIVKADRMGSIQLDIPDFYHDEKARKGLPACECLLRIVVDAKDAKGQKYHYTNLVNLDTWKRAPIPVANPKVESVKKVGDNRFEITIDTDKPAYYAWMALPGDPHAIFSDNAMTLLPGKTKITLDTTIPYTEAKLKKELTLVHLRQTY